MNKHFFCLAVFSATLGLFLSSSDMLMAQTAEAARSDQDLAKENAALRRQNAELRDRLRRLESATGARSAVTSTRATNIPKPQDHPASAAMAAAPVGVSPASPTWTGFYVGGNIGYSWGNSRTDLSGSVNSVSAASTLGGITNPPVGFASSSSSQQADGLIGGGQIGLNYQFSPQWVLGFEFDIQGSRERGSGTVVDPFSGQVCVQITQIPGNPPVCVATGPATGLITTTYDARIDWFGTARGRLGILTTDQLLLYGTGGLAYGRVELSGVASVNASSAIGTPVVASAVAFDTSKVNVGFAVGGGLEGRFSSWLPSAWTWKFEYLYVDLGSFDAVTQGGSPRRVGGGFFASSIGTVTTHARFTDHVARVGLNYKLF